MGDRACGGRNASPRHRNGFRAASWIAIVLGLAGSPALSEEHGDRDGWQSLFNGSNLDGWSTYLADSGRNRDPGRVFQVHDGVIHLYKDHAEGAAAPKGYFASEATYGFYHLRFQYNCTFQEPESSQATILTTRSTSCRIIGGSGSRPQPR
jgi:hypothetical protein